MRLTLLAAATAFAVLPGIAFASTVVVSPDNLNGWAFSNADNSGTNASGAFVTGPAPAPLGQGSAQFTVGDTNSSEILYNLALGAGSTANDFTSFSYATYRASPIGTASVLEAALAINIAIGGHYAGRLVFEPYLSGATTLDNTWQTWDPMTQNGWYASHQTAGNACTMADPCSWSTLMGTTFVKGGTSTGSTFGTAAVDGGVLFKAGSGWNSFQGNVDAFSVGISGDKTQFDFEPSVPEPASVAMLAFALLGLGLVYCRSVKGRSSIPA